MKVYINREAFEYIEKRVSVTPEELAEKFGIKKASAASWLSKWASRGYLEFVSVPIGGKRRVGRPKGCYKIGSLWWGRLVFNSERVPWT